MSKLSGGGACICARCLYLNVPPKYNNHYSAPGDPRPGQKKRH
jgi:hypothetical protein